MSFDVIKMLMTHFTAMFLCLVPPHSTDNIGTTAVRVDLAMLLAKFV